MRFIYFCVVSLFFYVPVFSQSPQSMRWDFDDVEGWVYYHQDDNPARQYILENGCLRIFTRANSFDRKKFRTKEKVYTTGRYKWRTFISDLGEGDQSSIGAWIYCDDHHEIDFEVGYGKQEVREQLQAAPDEVIAYMTTQDHPFQSVPVKIKKGWHIFEIDLSLVDGKYKVEWMIDGETVSTVQQTYGKEIAFHIYCSVENLKFLGDHIASQDNYALYDFVSYEYRE